MSSQAHHISSALNVHKSNALSFEEDVNQDKINISRRPSHQISIKPVHLTTSPFNTTKIPYQIAKLPKVVFPRSIEAPLKQSSNFSSKNNASAVPSNADHDRTSTTSFKLNQSDATKIVTIKGPGFAVSHSLNTESSKNGEATNTASNSFADSNVTEKYKQILYDFESLKVERDSYVEQLKIQSQVNDELKKLLVATMGDDLEIKMECLTRDKVKLAKDIVKYTSDLSDEKEQLERVCIQSDVWRSKFLASSVMIDELVSLRYVIVNQYVEAQKVIKRILDERETFRQQVFKAFKALNLTNEALSVKDVGKYEHSFKCHSMADLCHDLVNLSQDLQAKFLNSQSIVDSLKSNVKIKEPVLSRTEAEEGALKILNFDAQNFQKFSPCDEFQHLTDRQAQLMGFPTQCNFRNLTVNCCKKCEGEIKVV